MCHKDVGGKALGTMISARVQLTTGSNSSTTYRSQKRHGKKTIKATL